MTKRIAILVVVVLIIVTGPILVADCWRCSVPPPPYLSKCVVHTSSVIQGWSECYDDETGCYPYGNRCYAQYTKLSTPLAAEYAVASVERLDEPQTAAEAETVIADATPTAR